jgi:UDP:flavonoid glycosyltransferase YjiC (YdhE family)
MESVVHAVPIVSVPVAVDQPVNAYIAQSIGFGETLDKEQRNDFIQVSRALKRVIDTDSYHKTSRTLQEIYSNHKNTSRDKSIELIQEQLLLKNGSRHITYNFKPLLLCTFALLCLFFGITLSKH